MSNEGFNRENMQNPAKIALRKQIKKLLQEMTPQNRATQSEVIAKKLFLLPAYKASKRVSIYLSTEMEVNTLPILKDLFENKKEVFVPTYKGDVMEMVKINDLEDYESLPMTKWNIKQPSADEGRENPLKTGPLDIILLPGVAFAMLGGRCGHGKGYYDKFLSNYFEKYPGQALLVGLAFKEQIVDEAHLPIDPHDCPIDLILTSDFF